MLAISMSIARSCGRAGAERVTKKVQEQRPAGRTDLSRERAEARRAPWGQTRFQRRLDATPPSSCCRRYALLRNERCPNGRHTPQRAMRHASLGLADPTGYGRVVRAPSSMAMVVLQVVEQRDDAPETRVREVWTSSAHSGATAGPGLSRLSPTTCKASLRTDVVECWRHGATRSAKCRSLKKRPAASRSLAAGTGRTRAAQPHQSRWLLNGVTMLDRARVHRVPVHWVAM